MACGARPGGVCRVSTRFDTIVAGSDGTRGRVAAALGQRIARATGARLLLVGIECDLPLALVETHAQARATLEADLRALRDELAPDALIQVAVDLSPSHALRRVAESEGADLIVVGSLHRGRLQRLTSADRTMQVLHGAPCAVAVAPDHLMSSHALGTIGVGIDATPESGVALEMALELAQAAGASLRLLAVASDVYAGTSNLVAGASYAHAYREIVDARLRRAREAIERALERCSDAGVPSSGDVQLGDAPSELVALSADCDLLALGSRRWGPIRRLALGSTAERVLRDAACPVLVPPRHAATEHAEDEQAAAATVVF